MRAVEQNPVRRAFGGKSHSYRQIVEPGPGDVFRRQGSAVCFEHDQSKCRVVNVVIGFAVSDVSTTASCPDRRALKQRNVVAQRQGIGSLQVLLQRIEALAHGQHFHRFTEQAAGDPALPCTANARFQISFDHVDYS